MDWSPIFISLKTASVSICFTFFLGIVFAWFVMNLKNNALKILFDNIFTLSLVLPPTVVGFLLLYVFGLKGKIGQFLLSYFGYKIVFTWQATVLAAVAMSFPLMYQSAKGAFEQVDGNLLDAARTLGMREWDIFWKVLMPNAYPGIISGAILAFTRGLGEFGATAMIAGNIVNKTRTLPMAIYLQTQAGNTSEALGYVLIVLMIAFISITMMDLFSIRFERKKK